MKKSQYVNVFDREIVEALERLFITDLPKIEVPSPPNLDIHSFESELADFENRLDVYEDEAMDYHVVKWLRWTFIFFLLATINRLVVAIVGVEDPMSGMYSMIATFFFGFLFLMLHLETNNQSLILLFLTCASLWLGIW